LPDRAALPAIRLRAADARSRLRGHRPVLSPQARLTRSRRTRAGRRLPCIGHGPHPSTSFSTSAVFSRM